MRPANRFYVYEHWRPDKDVCFWVGKGNGDRAFRFRRNLHYNNIVAKLSRLGMCVEVRMVASGMTEDEALSLEITRITFWRSAGIALANVTSGGEGVSGLKHSEKTRADIREKRKRQVVVHSNETKRKIGLAHKGRRKGIKRPEHSARLKGRPLTPEHRAAIANGSIGRIVTPETRTKISNKNRGRIRSGATRQKLSEAHRGKRHTAQTLEKMSSAQKRVWLDPVERAKRSAYRNDPERKAKWVQSLRAKPPFTDEHRKKLSEATKADWARRKATATGDRE